MTNLYFSRDCITTPGVWMMTETWKIKSPICCSVSTLQVKVVCPPRIYCTNEIDWPNAEWPHGCYEGEIGHRDKNNVVAEIGRISTGVCWGLEKHEVFNSFRRGRLLAHLLTRSAKKLMNMCHVTVSVSFSVCNTGCSSESVCEMITERVITKITLKVKV